jgi:hypothetical protein
MVLKLGRICTMSLDFLVLLEPEKAQLLILLLLLLNGHVWRWLVHS